MKIKVSVIATTILLASFIPKANSAVTVDDIKNLLGKYCYPKEEDCGTAREPIYNASNSSCSCVNKTYLYYDAEDRRCNPKCPAGYSLKTVSKCSGGSFKFEVK